MYYYSYSLNLAYYNSGGVLIQEDNKLSSRLGFYNSNTKRFVFQDSVRLVNPRYRIIADTLHYGSDNKTAYFYGPTEIKSKESNIFCELGYYNTNNDTGYFIKEAKVDFASLGNEETCTGDSARRIGNEYLFQTMAEKNLETFGKYKFKNLPLIGDRIALLDQAHYTMVKTSFFNGIKLPSIALWDSETDNIDIIKQFSYKDFEDKL